jgi:3-isopropylmalate dehydrogenase
VKDLKLLVLDGDGIGPEVCRQGLAVLQLMAEREGLQLNVEHDLAGGACIDDFGVPIRDATLQMAREADAVLLGAVGGPKWDDRPSEQRPEKGLLRLREAMQVFANLRPTRTFAPLLSASPLKLERARCVDFVVVRELVGGIYFGEPRGVEWNAGERSGRNTMVYTESAIRRIGRFAFDLARKRQGRLCSVDKANVLEVQALWRSILTDLAADYPDVALSHLYVDNCAMQLILQPSQFDVLVTSNMFGDILSDEAAAITGSLGMLPSASLGEGSALYEPVHGSAPQIAGQDRANPLATILSVAMLLSHTLGRADLMRQVETAVDEVLLEGLRTEDIMPVSGRNNLRLVSTTQMGQAVVARLKASEAVPA